MQAVLTVLFLIGCVLAWIVLILDFVKDLKKKKKNNEKKITSDDDIILR